MQTSTGSYSAQASADRIDEILTASDHGYEEKDSIPARSSLTYKNGFYVNCTCVFMDIRDSSALPAKYKRPTVGKIYRSYISESVALLNSRSGCKEVNIDGDAVWGVFSTPYKPDVDDAFAAAASLSSVVDILNCRFSKKAAHISPIKVGIGIEYGRALMIQAGYKGSGIKEVVWMGDTVNQASKLCSYGNQAWTDREMMVSSSIYGNLNEHNQSLLTWHANRNCWHGNVINTTMNDWVKANCG